MGLFKSKHQIRKGEEQKKGPAYSVSKSKEKAPERPSLEARQADTEPRDSIQKPEPAKSSKKKIAIPQIVITRPSNETLLSCSSMEIKEQKTIKEHAGWGPLARHRNPSTVDAYSSKDRE